MLRPTLLASVGLALAACAAPPRPAVPPVGPVVRVPFAVDLGGFTTAAELVHPAPGGPHGDGPYPVVLLLHGNGPHDLDVTLAGPDGTVRLFAQIAEAFAARGAAVVRYHKRFVKGPRRFDARFWREQSTPQFTRDAGTVLAAALAQPACDPRRLCLYGWSEGTAVAAQLAADRGDIGALILQGSVGLPWRELTRSWIVDTALPLARSAPDGPVTAASLLRALRTGGPVAQLGAAFLSDPTAPPAAPRVGPRLDGNGDGQLDPATEVLPQVEAMLDFAFAPGGNCYVYAEGRTVPPATAHAAALRMPVLLLQGECDASTPPRSAQALAAALQAAGNPDVELRLLPGLGHTLGPAASPADDRPRAPGDAVLAEAAAWWWTRATAPR